MSRQLELLQGTKYARLGRNGKVYYVTESEAMAEEVLTTPEDTVRDSLVREANLIKERISVVHQMMREDERRPSQYRVDCDMLWYRYQEIIHRLREINPEPIDQFRDKVVARINELEVRLNTYYLLSDAGVWNPGDFDDFERLLALYEKSYDQAAVLSR